MHLHEKTLTSLESMLLASFARVHRSYIANLDHLRGVRAAALVLNDDSIVPVGRGYRDNVRQRMASRNSWTCEARTGSPGATASVYATGEAPRATRASLMAARSCRTCAASIT